MVKSALNSKSIIIFAFLFVTVKCWLKCNDTFCGRIRERSVNPKSIELDFGSTLQLKNTGVEANLKIKGQSSLKFYLSVVQDSTFHFLIEEPSSPRYLLTDILVRDFKPILIQQPVKTNNSLITVQHGNNTALIYKSPFKVEFYNNDNLISVANWNESLIFESQTDKKGAIALDILFPQVEQAYGIPLHADHLALRSTVVDGSEPYRLYNVGNGNYTVNSTEALHGSVPVLYAHGSTQSSGIFWLNSAQTWVDINTAPNQIDVYFMSETGPLEMFILMGPTLPEAVVEYSKLTGVAPLPQYFALGYHQSRYSLSQYDIYNSAKKFLLADLPLDSIWLDFEYTEGRKYFTWDPIRYADPYDLLLYLDINNQKLVALINPHFKNDSTYLIDYEAKLKGYYVKKPTGEDYLETCLPGLSSWLDFLNPDARDFYARHYSTATAFTNRNLHISNDMNEPVVFNNESYEKTLLPELIHFNATTHRQVHNIYGFYQTMATLTGLLKRNNNIRPFVLTRSHFAGSQRYAAVWTGENYASWEHLRISLPMCLSEALAGISFCGANVGGFDGIPDDELYIRWYQAGAWLPFYRGSYAFYVPQREPYLYEKSIQDKIRKALRLRYAHIPLWYLVFRQHELTREPVIRPLTYHYPEEKETLHIDDEILVGPNVLAAPVLESGIESKEVYLPGGETQIWYNIDESYKIYHGSGYQRVPVNLDSVPVFYKGGSIIPRKDKERNSTAYLQWDYYTLYVSPDINGEARGSLYDDDCRSLNYKDNEYVNVDFAFSKNVLTSKVDRTGLYPAASGIEKISILNPPQGLGKANYIVGEKIETTYDVKYLNEGRILEITFGVFAKIDIRFEFKVEVFKSDIGGRAVTFKPTISIWVFLFVMFSRMVTHS